MRGGGCKEEEKGKVYVRGDGWMVRMSGGEENTVQL